METATTVAEAPRIETSAEPAATPNEIVVLDRGYVYVGQVSEEGENLVICSARNIRRWGTTAGLGQLATSGPTSSTVLDPAGTVKAPMRAVIHRLVCKTNW